MNGKQVRHGHRPAVEFDIDEKRVPHGRHLVAELMFDDVEDELHGEHVEYSPFICNTPKANWPIIGSRFYRGLFSSSIVLAL